MLQQIMTGPGALEFREVGIPACGDHDVMLKIMRVGICGSDMHVYHGKHAFSTFPLTQGHEVSGEVVLVGKNVAGICVGQKATIEPQIVCGKCHPCRHGKYNLCEKLKVMGFQAPGAASEYFVADAEKITLLPDAMSFDQGAMIEPLAVAVHAVKRTGDVTGMSVAVLGAGPIGNLMAQTAKSLGASEVMITDVSDFRLSLAKTCGIDFCVNTKNENFGDAMVRDFGPDKADVIIDCAGNNTTIGQAIRYARKGSVILLVAVFADTAAADFAVLNDHELDLNTSMMYRHEDYVEAIRLVNAGMIKLDPLMTKHFAFKDYLHAYHYIENNKETTMKVLIDVHP